MPQHSPASWEAAMHFAAQSGTWAWGAQEDSGKYLCDGPAEFFLLSFTSQLIVLWAWSWLISHLIWEEEITSPFWALHPSFINEVTPDTVTAALSPSATSHCMRKSRHLCQPFTSYICTYLSYQNLLCSRLNAISSSCARFFSSPSLTCRICFAPPKFSDKAYYSNHLYLTLKLNHEVVHHRKLLNKWVWNGLEQLKNMRECFRASSEKTFMHTKQWRITIKSSGELKLICPAIT